jgi:hypothetical protein
MALHKTNLSPLFSEDVNNIASNSRVVSGYDITISGNNVIISGGSLIWDNNKHTHSSTSFTVDYTSAGKHRYDLIYFNPNTTNIERVEGTEVDTSRLPTSPDVNGLVLYRLYVTESSITSEDLRVEIVKRVDDLTTNNLTVEGDLTVNGTTTTINTTNLEVEDNIITLNKGETGAGVSEGKAGLMVDRGSENDAVLIYDESDDKWKVGFYDGTNFIDLQEISVGEIDLSNVSSDVVPASDNVYDLGKSDKRWANVYAVNGTINQLLKVGWQINDKIFVSPTGGGDGSSEDSPTTLEDALIRAKGRVCEIVLLDGEYHIDKSYEIVTDFLYIHSLSYDASKVKIIFDSKDDGSYNYSWSIQVTKGILRFSHVTLENAPKSNSSLPWGVGGGGGAPIVVGNGGYREGTVVFAHCVINQTRDYFVSSKHANGSVVLTVTTVNMSDDAVAFIIPQFGTVRIAEYDSTITSGYKWSTGYLGYDFITNNETADRISGTYHWFPAADNTYDLGKSDKRWRDGYFAGNVYVGDVVFQNKWRITEYDDNKNKLPYLRVLNEKGEEVFIIYNSFILKGLMKLEMGVKRFIKLVKKIFKR